MCPAQAALLLRDTTALPWAPLGSLVWAMAVRNAPYSSALYLHFLVRLHSRKRSELHRSKTTDSVALQVQFSRWWGSGGPRPLRTRALALLLFTTRVRQTLVLRLEKQNVPMGYFLVSPPSPTCSQVEV